MSRAKHQMITSTPRPRPAVLHLVEEMEPDAELHINVDGRLVSRLLPFGLHQMLIAEQQSIVDYLHAKAEL